MGIDASELRDLAISLNRVPARAESRVRAAVAKVGNDTVARAQVAAPVDTGNLQSSIGVDITDGGLGLSAGPTADYGAHVEYGTETQAPQPYMHPAFDRGVGVLEKALGRLAGEALQ